jgi:hypothetical protein
LFNVRESIFILKPRLRTGELAGFLCADRRTLVSLGESVILAETTAAPLTSVRDPVGLSATTVALHIPR